MQNISGPIQVNISSLTIVKVLLVSLGLGFLWAIRDILAIVFVAWVLASALDPFIDKLQRFKIPRAISILGIYVLALIAFAGVIALLVPAVSNELAGIAQDIPAFYEPIRSSIINIQSTGEQLGVLAAVQESLDGAVRSIVNLSDSLYTAAASVLGGVVTTFGILVIAFYMTVEEDNMKQFIHAIAPINYQPYILRKLNQIQHKLSSWLWGQILLMLFVGAITGASLWILGMDYWLVLGLFAGLTEFIPIIGPIIAAVPAVFFSFSEFGTSPWKPFIIMALYVVIQQVENQILVPRVMKKAVGINPIIAIVALLIGAKLGGLVGVLLSIPLVTIMQVFLSDFVEERKREHNRLET